MALVDTGASSTCISPSVVSDLGLIPTGIVPIAGVHGSVPTNTYQFLVGFVIPQQPLPSGVVAATMHTFPISGAEFAVGGAVFDVLLGRDVLCLGHFTMTFAGQFFFSF
jgi:hypothetical protein